MRAKGGMVRELRTMNAERRKQNSHDNWIHKPRLAANSFNHVHVCSLPLAPGSAGVLLFSRIALAVNRYPIWRQPPGGAFYASKYKLSPASILFIGNFRVRNCSAELASSGEISTVTSPATFTPAPVNQR